jgi:hypothetical protein
MDITFDPDKRERTLRDRGLDFADTDEVFAALTIDIADTRLRRGSIHHRRLSTRPHGCRGVDATRRRPAHCFDEEGQ